MLTQRQERLLTEIVNNYIQTAEPVSSKIIEKLKFFDLSSATIRNEMNDLERQGYLAQPHVSSGRVPTDRAYRFFVDKLIRTHELDPGDPLKRKISQTIREAGDDPHEVNKSVAQLLNSLSESLVITNVRESDDFYKVGLSSLLNFPEFREFERVFNLTSFFDQFEEIFNRLEAKISDDIDLHVFIGEESSIGEVEGETIITGVYDLPHKYTGTITLIGPTRMDYGKNISLIKYTVDELNRIF